MYAQFAKIKDMVDKKLDTKALEGVLDEFRNEMKLGLEARSPIPPASLARSPWRGEPSPCPTWEAMEGKLAMGRPASQPKEDPMEAMRKMQAMQDQMAAQLESGAEGGGEGPALSAPAPDPRMDMLMGMVENLSESVQNQNAVMRDIRKRTGEVEKVVPSRPRSPFTLPLLGRCYWTRWMRRT
jgi:hypothetical protein